MIGELNNVKVATGRRIAGVYRRYDDVPDLLRPLKGDRFNEPDSLTDKRLGIHPINPTEIALFVFPKVQGSTDGATKTFSM
jgi:hypothetical protein